MPSKEAKRQRTEPRLGEVVYYRIHRKKIDRYCGAFDRSYLIEHVDIPHGRTDVLKRALEALFQKEWNSPRAVDSANLEGGLATIDLRSTKGIGFASTSCGGISFLGSLLRTIFQFDEVQQARVLLRQSCEEFGEVMESICATYTRASLHPQRSG